MSLVHEIFKELSNETLHNRIVKTQHIDYVDSPTKFLRLTQNFS